MTDIKQKKIESHWESKEFNGNIRVITLDFPDIDLVLKLGKAIYALQIDLNHNSSFSTNLPLWSTVGYYTTKMAAIQEATIFEKEVLRVLQLSKILSATGKKPNKEDMN